MVVTPIWSLILLSDWESSSDLLTGNGEQLLLHFCFDILQEFHLDLGESRQRGFRVSISILILRNICGKVDSRGADLHFLALVYVCLLFFFLVCFCMTDRGEENQ